MKRNLHKCSLTLRPIGHTRTGNGLFKLVEALLQTHSCFFSQSTNVRGLPLSDSISMSLSRCITCQDVCVQQSHATKRLLEQNKVNLRGFVDTVLLRNTAEQSARDFRKPPLQAKEET